MSFLPDSNRTDKLAEFIKVAFDQVYNKIYKQQKNLKTLYDPSESEPEYLDDLTKGLYGTDIDLYALDDEERLRDLTRSMPIILKKKGTYSSLIGIWKFVAGFDSNIDNDGTMKTVASNFDIWVYFKHRPDIRVKYTHYDHRSKESWDYGIFGVNYIHPYRLKNNTWQPDNIQGMIRDSENPLAVITRRSNHDDYRGVSFARNGNYKEAVTLLENAIPGNLNNFILFEYLAESYYHLGRTKDCIRTVELGKEIHPWCEKLNMLEAQIEFDRGDYDVALEKCLKIVENNSKYYIIVPLLIACYEKTGDMDMALKLKRKYDIR